MNEISGSDRPLIVPQFSKLPGAPDRAYYAVIPPGMTPGTAPLVAVHGISRNAAELALRFGQIAAESGVPVIAPLFERRAYGMYQQVVDPRRAIRADEALFDILADAQRRFGTGSGRFSLFGFSGGAQFAHRLALLHPERIACCIAAAAGWYTMPDAGTTWPLGLENAPLPVRSEAAARVPFHVIVGDRDREQDEALRRSDEIDAAQGTNRLQRARRWHRAMARAGFGNGGSITVVPRLGHSFSEGERRGLVSIAWKLLGFATEAEPCADREEMTA